MTTTSTFQGMDLEKPSSKVLAPPGGKSNIFFGGSEDDQPKQPKPQPAQQKTPAPVQQDCSPAKSAKPQNNSGFNLLSGEPATPPVKSNGGARQAQDRVDPANLPAAGARIEERQVTRKMPPGGASSFSFGN